jgi:hypothetical protein
LSGGGLFNKGDGLTGCFPSLQRLFKPKSQPQPLTRRLLYAAKVKPFASAGCHAWRAHNTGRLFIYHIVLWNFQAQLDSEQR